ncbi:MAG: apolipoprotein N-acyltransferase [Planctomycetota bacterium]|nr:MAG: apolipoprotein N-acyltransferase [Planctomycetota bacterium]
MRLIQITSLCFLCAVLNTLALDPFNLSFLALVAWTPLVFAAQITGKWRQNDRVVDGVAQVCDRRATWRLALLAWLFGSLRWLWLESWIGPVSDYGWPALAIVMGAFDGVFAVALSRTERGTRYRNWPLAIRAGIILCGSDWFRSRVFMDGYPWFMPAQPLIDFPWLAQGADVIGVAGLGIIPGLIAGMLVGMIAPPRTRWRAGAWTTMACMLLALSYGFFCAPSTKDCDTFKVLLIQTNVAQSNKMAPTREMQQTQFDGALKATMDALKTLQLRGEMPDLIAWPETVLPGVGLESDAIMLQRERGIWPADTLSLQLEKLVNENAPLLVGSGAYEGLRIEGNRYAWDRHYNSGYLLRSGGRHERVDKVVLTPFGETMPYISYWKALEQAMLDFGGRGMEFDLSIGERPRTLSLQTATRRVALAVPICFEDTVPRATRSLVNADEGADVIVNLSNDGWFGWFDPARRHHEQAARWRCVELRRSMLRVVNTGISAAFDTHGQRIGNPLPPQQEGWMLAELPLEKTRTTYATIGDVFSWFMFFITGFMCCWPNTKPKVRSGAGALVSLCACVFLMACSETKQGKLPSWSSRDQSSTPDNDVTLSRKNSAKAQIPVSNSSDLVRNARLVLDEASRNSDKSLRAHAIESMQYDMTIFEPGVRRGLADREPSVRFVSAMSVAKLRMPGAGPLIEPLKLDPNESVQAAAILALTRCGTQTNPSPLAKMILSQSAELRGNTAMVLGELGNKSALIMLKEATRQPMSRANPAAVRIVNLQIAEAMVQLGDQSEIEPIHAALFFRSDQSECIELACEIASRLHDQGSLPMLQRLVEADGGDIRPIEIRLFAAIAACKIMQSPPSGLAGLGVISSHDPNVRVRTLAAKLLGVVGGADTESVLSRLLRDREPEVQVAAAGSILRRQMTLSNQATSIESQLPQSTVEPTNRAKNDIPH